MENEFDYIIVGAGSAGCVLANRLSELRDNSVLLIRGRWRR